MQSDSREQPCFLVQGAKNESQDAECQTRGENPFETPSGEQSREAQHGDDFGDLTERHQCARAFKAELLQVVGCVRIECRERDAE